MNPYRKRSFLVALFLWGLPYVTLVAQQYQWTNVAGMPGGAGNKDGGPGVARYLGPRALARDSSGNIYVLDAYRVIRKVTTTGVVSTVAVLPDGYTAPTGITVGVEGSIYYSDFNNRTIRQVTPSGVVTTFAGSPGESGIVDGTGSSARFWGPNAIASDSMGNLYVADGGAIRIVTPAAVVTTLAGVAGTMGSVDGAGSVARFKWPDGLAVDGSGIIYVSDNNNGAIRKVTPAGVVTTLAGSLGNYGHADGTGTEARFGLVSGVTVDASGNVYVADGSTIRKVTAVGVVTTLAGSNSQQGYLDGVGSAARFSYIDAVLLDHNGDICVADRFADPTIRKVTPSGVVSTWSGSQENSGYMDGVGSAARFYRPHSIASNNDGTLFISVGFPGAIRKLTPPGNVTTKLGPSMYPDSNVVPEIDAYVSSASGVATDTNGSVYIADRDHYTILKVAAGHVTTLAGNPGTQGSADGNGSAASFYEPGGVATDTNGNVYVLDNHTIRKVTAAGVVTTLAGSPGNQGSVDGAGSTARFSNPGGIAVDRLGNLYVADTWNYTIRKVTATGVVTTLAGLPWNWGTADGIGTAARFTSPSGIAVDTDLNLYVTDTWNHTIRKVTQAGVVTTIGGTPGRIGGDDGLGPVAEFSSPLGIAVTSNGLVYVADTDNNRIAVGVPFGPEIVVMQPDNVNLLSGESTVSCGSFAVGGSATKTITIKNTGNQPLTGLAVSLYGSHASSYSLNTTAMSTNVAAGDSTSFNIIFTPTGVASGVRLADLHIASNDADENPFYVSLSGQIYSATLDTDGDGLNDWAEFLYSPLGFDWQVNQASLVSVLNSGANAAGHYTPSQVQAIHVGAPLLTRDAASGQFKLTLGIEKSTNLLNFAPFPLSAPQTTINGDGKMEFLFTAPDNAAFFRVQGQ